ncbi:MAG: ROK family protein [Candidatus Kapaibacterium sp.]
MEETIAIGVDVGGTTIKAGLVRGDGTLLRHAAFDTRAAHGPDAVIERMAEAINSLLNGDEPVASIGLGVPGVVNNRGEISYPPNFPGWGVVNVAERLRPYLPAGIRIVVENDANVAAYAEARAGTGSSDRDFLFITLGTGVGGCIISGGNIWRGATGGAGEMGHVSIDINGPLCNCGARGCIEAYIGHRYMATEAARRLERDPDSLLHAMIAAGKELDPKLVDEAAVAGDPFAREFLAEMGTLLGAALASMTNMTDMHLVIVGGGLSHAEKYLLGPARRSLQLRAIKSISLDVELRVARFSNDAGMIGAALLSLAS